MLTPNKQSKSVLSRLMASENITVIHNPEARTASFDLRNRVLTLPVLGEMSDELYDMIVGHEVGHAIYTPYTEEDEKNIKAGKPLAAAVKIGGDNAILAMGYLNVVEDARIEKLMKEKFAGLRRDFHIGYKDLYDRDFFEVKSKNINEMPLIDRINLHFKVGSSVVGGIKFNDDEFKFVNEIENARTFDEVLDITQRLWDYCKEQRENEKDENQQELDDIYAMLGMDGNGHSNSDGSEGKIESKNGNIDKYSTKGLKPHECATQNSLENYLKKMQSSNSYASYFYQSIPKLKSNVIVGYKQIMAEYAACSSIVNIAPEYRLAENDYKEFCHQSKSTVNLLVKQFLMKKAAKDSRRSMVHRTGNLDTVRMMNYNFTDDIFLRNTIVKKGKSHGLTFFMDWSGSMHICFGDTMKQLFQVVLFCRQLNIPFEVYGFTSRVMTDYNDKCWEYSDDIRGLHGEFHDFRLLNILSSKMTKHDFHQMMRNLFAQINHYENRRADHLNYMDVVPTSMELSSTPLNETVVAAIDIVNRFKAENKLDIVNAIFLTDGETTGSMMPWSSTNYSSNYIFGKQTYELSTHKSSTDCLIEVFRDQTNCRAIGIYLETKKKGGMGQNTKYRYFVYDNNGNTTEADKMYDKEGFALADHRRHGYDDLFIIRGNSEIEDDDLDAVLAEKKTKTSIRNAFNKTLDSKISSRVMLNRFIDLIAVD